MKFFVLRPSMFLARWYSLLILLAVLLAVVLSALALALGGGTGHAQAPAMPLVGHPPGWVAHPSGPNPNDVACYNAVCYNVDSNGNPFGAPIP